VANEVVIRARGEHEEPGILDAFLLPQNSSVIFYIVSQKSRLQSFPHNFVKISP